MIRGGGGGGSCKIQQRQIYKKYSFFNQHWLEKCQSRVCFRAQTVSYKTNAIRRESYTIRRHLIYDLVSLNNPQNERHTTLESYI